MPKKYGEGLDMLASVEATHTHMAMSAQASRDEVIHDLKNQLSIILGFTDALDEELTGATERQRADLAQIRKAAQAAIARVRDLGARPSTGSDR